MILLYNFLAVLITTLVEALRIKFTKGEVIKINTIITYSIAGVLFSLVLLLTGEDRFIHVGLLALNYAFCRGTIYSPILNLLRGESMWYMTKTPDKALDKFMMNHNIKPQLVMLVSFLLWVTTSIIYYVAK